MTWLYIFGLSWALLGLVAFFFGRVQRELGATKAELAERNREAAISRKQADIVAENRTPEDAAKALDRGGY